MQLLQAIATIRMRFKLLNLKDNFLGNTHHISRNGDLDWG